MNTQNDSFPPLSQEQGRLLVRLARETISRKLGLSNAGEEERTLEQTLDEDIFKNHCGTFVTLKISGQLRGCIGSLMGYRPLVEGVRENALNAAFRDPRFDALTQEELSKVEIEVSVLSHPQALAYENADDLLTKLRPLVDGVILRQGLQTATFLPQVWEQLPKPKDFLRNLCLKAGLPADEWRQGQLEISTYQVQYFEEKDWPGSDAF